ncbi:MAG: hypothetical protein U5K72_19740 [Balneolaceae bacterium]|nr:hypothetical protein [Balneolaceae bacterium]
MTIHFEQKGIILDACCIINLYASSVMQEVLESFQLPFYVDRYVKEREALKIKGEKENEFIDIDLLPFIQDKILHEVSLSGEDEVNTFVNLAVSLDDGEARCGAIAAHRNLVVATDEKVGIRIFSGLGPPISTISTLEILHDWSVNKNITTDKISMVLKKIEKRASYRPGSKHAYFEWWKKHYQIG